MHSQKLSRMNKKFYHLGRRLSAVFLSCFSIFSFIPNASAQECGSVTLGDNVSICNGYEAMNAAKINRHSEPPLRKQGW